MTINNETKPAEPTAVQIARKALRDEFNIGFIGRYQLNKAVAAVEGLINAKVNEIVDARVQAALAKVQAAAE